MLKLPDVTLVCIETREHALAKLAIEDCLALAEFGEVLIMTDKPKRFGMLRNNARMVEVPDWPTKEGWSRCFWYDAQAHVRTSHTLNIQWDSWIWQPDMWRPEFLNYDYIGAVWGWHNDGMRVGNGGFSLISTAFKRYVADRRAAYPCTTAIDDDLYCRKYRPRLEDAGFVWAPEHVAHDFAFECSRPSPTSRHFGFHAFFNFPVVLDRDRMLERFTLAMESPYISRMPVNPNDNSYNIMKAFCQANPELARELLAAVKAPTLAKVET